MTPSPQTISKPPLSPPPPPPPLPMSFDQRVTRKFYNHEWSTGRCTLHITTESVATSPDPDLTGRAWLDMILVSSSLSPYTVNRNFLPPLTGAWAEEIPAAKALNSTASWLRITSLIDTTHPRVPLNVRQDVLLTICAEAKDAAEKAIFLEHTVVCMSMYVDVQTEIGGYPVKLECNHEFSIERVIQWVTQNHLCPICNPEV